MSKPPLLTALDATSLALKAAEAFCGIANEEVLQVYVNGSHTGHSRHLPYAEIELVAEHVTPEKYVQLRDFKAAYGQICFCVYSVRQDLDMNSLKSRYLFRIEARYTADGKIRERSALRQHN